MAMLVPGAPGGRGAISAFVDDRAALRRDIRQRNDHCPLLTASCAQESKGGARRPASGSKTLESRLSAAEIHNLLSYAHIE